MAKTVKKDNLGFLGESFQEQLVKYFIEDQTFFKNIECIVDQNMFTDERFSKIVGFMKDRYSQNETVPNYEELEIISKNRITDGNTLEIIIATLQRLRDDVKLIGIDLITDMSEKFFKQQNLIKAINKAKDIVQLGDINRYDETIKLFEKVLEVNTKKDNGFHIFDNFDDAFSDSYRITMSTGSTELDRRLMGGIAKGELGAIIAPSGVGKAQPLTSKVLTPTGFKKMGEIKVGDSVIGSDGKPYKVSGVYPQGIRPVYRVDFLDGRSCECDIDHLWNVNSFYQRTRKTYVRGSGVKNMKREYNPDNTFKTLSLREMIDNGVTKTVSGKNGLYEKYVFKIPRNNIVDFDKREISLDPYFVGYYIGDGCFSRKQISVGVLDKEEAYLNLNEATGGDLIPHFREKRKIWDFVVSGETRKKCGNVFGGCKSNEKEIPEEYLINSTEVRIALLQGLMDSDGSCDKKHHIEFSTKSEKLAQQVAFLVRSLGGFANIKKKKSSYFSKKYNKTVECGESYRLHITMFDDHVKPFRFERKQKNVKYATNDSYHTLITNIEYLRDDYTQCIYIDSKEHLYLTDDFIVTHNTSATTGFAAAAAIQKCKANNNKGWKVLHVFFEDDDVNIKRKYYAYLTGVESCDLSKPEFRDYAKNLLKTSLSEQRKMIQDNIVAIHAVDHEFSATDLKQKIKHLMATGFKPDLVILDYFECLKLEKPETSSDTEWTREALTMRKLESIAHELELGIWCPIQGSKESVDKDYISMAMGGGSFKKVQIAQIVMSFAKTPEQKAQNLMNVIINKFRAGAIVGGGKITDIEFNNGTCRFGVCHGDDVDSALDNFENDAFLVANQIN